jgi:hypothetical protein
MKHIFFSIFDSFLIVRIVYLTACIENEAISFSGGFRALFDLPVFKQILEWIRRNRSRISEREIVNNKQAVNKSNKSPEHPYHEGMVFEARNIEETKKNQINNCSTDERNPH